MGFGAQRPHPPLAGIGIGEEPDDATAALVLPLQSL